MIGALKNAPHIKLVFSGSGPASEALRNYVKDNHLENTTFTGQYKKEDEVSIVNSHQMINIYLGRNINSDSLMSNRFYLSVLLRKPIIVNEDSYQADLVKQYNLGLILKPQDDFASTIIGYWTSIEWGKYNEGRKLFLDNVLKDMELFEENLLSLFYDNESTRANNKGFNNRPNCIL